MKPLEDSPLTKQIEIDAKDERNVSIANKAKATAFNFTLVIIAALIVFFVLIKVDKLVIFASIATYFLIVSVFIYFLKKYHKEM